MPDEIRDALREARAGSSGTIEDTTWRDRLAERFGARWKIVRLLADKRGKLSVAANQAGQLPRAAKPKRRATASSGGGSGGTGGPTTVGTQPGLIQARQSKVGGGIPTSSSCERRTSGQGECLQPGCRTIRNIRRERSSSLRTIP